MKKLIFLLILLSIIVLSSHNTPFWSQESVFPSYYNFYSSGQNYSFQINWTDSVQGIGGISSVIFETDILGLQNYTKGTPRAVQNNTNGMYWINFTDLPAGFYYYRWYANDTSNNFESTSPLPFTIIKYPTNLAFLYPENRSFVIGDIVNFTVWADRVLDIIYLDSTYPGWVLQSNTSSQWLFNSTNLTKRGIFDSIAYFNENQNYTAASSILYFDTIEPRHYNQSLIPTNPTTYARNQTYRFNVTWDDIDITFVYFESNHTGDIENHTYPLVQNNSQDVAEGDPIRFWVELLDLPAQTFLYRWISGDTANNVNTTIPITYKIQKASGLSLSIPISDIVEGEMVTAICYSNTDQITYEDFNFYRENELIPNISLLSRFESLALDIGSYDYVCNTTGNQNFSEQTSTRTVNVVEQSTDSNGDTKTKEFRISNVGAPTIASGETGETTFVLTNTYDETLINIEVDISGIIPEWYTVEDIPSALLTDGTTTIKIKFDIPEDTEDGVYDITIEVIADIEGDSGTKTVSQSMSLIIGAPPPIVNELPSYYNIIINNTVAGEPALFSLDWVDDTGLSSYIFSTNNSGEWANDSIKSVSERTVTATAEKILNSQVGATVAWKFYASDIDSEWSISEEFFITTTTKEGGGGIDFIAIITIIVVVIIIVVAIFYLRTKFTKVEKVIEYYYHRDEA
jgi:hypothetical protein